MRFITRRIATWGPGTLLVGGTIAAAMLTAAGIAGWEYSNSDHFCTNACHAVHPENSRSHASSAHARVSCVECHIGRVSTLERMALKTTHLHTVWSMITGYERPVISRTLQPARDNCEGCHWPKRVHNDSVRLRVRYGSDEASTETKYRLIMHTGFGAIRDGHAKGVHWHVESDVRYVALDPQRRFTPLVEVRGPDGKVTATFFDSTAGVTREQAGTMPRRRLECSDCHNTPGHPFPNPADAVDEAIARGEVDRALPSAKARAVALIAKAQRLEASPDRRGRLIDELIAGSVPRGELDEETKALEKKFAAAMKRILGETSFAQPGITWQSFPDHSAHKDWTGCFRCHGGKHLDDKGRAVRLQCTLCHSLPEVWREGDRLTVDSTVAPGMSPPPAHHAPNFMHDHRFKLDKTCAACHGPIKFGREGGSFCSNPACHGRTWPEVNLGLVKPPAN